MLAREMDSGIERIIDQNGHMTFIASMVFETTVCGYYEGKFITILDGRKKVLPMSIVMNGELKGRRYSIGDKIDVSRSVDSDLVVTEDTKLVDLSMHISYEYNLISHMHIQIRSALEGLKTETKGMLPIISILGMLSKPGEYAGIEAKLYSMVAARTKFLIADLMEGREITAENIVGYGIGLTPSADDFLLGVAAIFDRFGEVIRKELLAAYIEKYLHTTTEVSGWMLRYGMKSRLYPEIVLEYLEYPYPGELRIDEFLKHGSTSGIDLLCGILCGLEMLLEVKGR